MKYFSLFALLVFTISCTPTKSTNEVVDIEEEIVDSVSIGFDDEVAEPVVSCKNIATVKDNSGLDGCKYLIILENGSKLEPLVMEDKNFKFRDGQKIRLTYEQEREMMSICMAGQGVRVTCIEEIK